MKTYGTLHKVTKDDNSEFITVNVPGITDMFFPYGKPNDDYLINSNVVIENPEIITEFKEGQIVYGNNQINNDYNDNMKVINKFFIERFLSLLEYKKENFI